MMVHQLWEGFRSAASGEKESWAQRAYHLSYKGQALFALPMAGFSMGMAERGHKVSAGVSALASSVGSLLGGAAGGWVGATAAGWMLDAPIAATIGNGLQAIHDSERSRVALHLGGNYQDTQAAYTLRQRASLELSTSLLNARQYLGNEGVQFHS